MTIAAALGAAAVVIAAVVTARFGNKRQLDQIHVLVNSRLTEALDEIQSLKRQLKKAK